MTHDASSQSARNPEQTSPFHDAVAVWHMADLSDASGPESGLTPAGRVKVGIRLNGPDLEASLARAGDGAAAEFAGGWLSAEQGAAGELNLTGRTMSLCIRLRDPGGTWNNPIFAKHGGHENLTYNLFATDLGQGNVLGFELGTTETGLLRLTVPIAEIGATEWHDVVCRCNGAKVQLFVDGVCVDEDFMLGELRTGNAEPCLIGAETHGGEVKAGLDGLIDHVALWNRGLSDEEIRFLSGGTGVDAWPPRHMCDRPASTLQYWRPPNNFYVGDCFPFFHDGTFHLFYLLDKNHHKSKNGLGAHQWAQATTTDLVHWEHQPLAIPVTEQWEGSICTGSVFFHDGVYYGFYATRVLDKTQHLGLATSTDGVHFTKTEPNPFASPEPPYRAGPYRDPVVFQDPQTGLFHMLVTAALEESSLDGRADCLAHLTSADLRKWDVQQPFFMPGYTGAPECPDHFEWNGWYYLLFSNDGVARYRMARNPLGPWHRPQVDVFDGPQARVLKTAAFTGNRRLGAAFLAKDGYAGHAVFREIIQHDDGTLGTKFPAEMIPPCGDAVPLSFEALTDGASGNGEHVRLEAMGDMAVGMLTDVPHNVRITLHVRPEPDANYFGLCLRGAGRFGEGNEIRFSPPDQKVGIRSPLDPSVDENEEHALYNVSDLDQPFTLDIILKDDILDLCIDDRRTLVSRVNELQGDRLFFFAHHANVDLDGITVRPLRD